MGHRPDHDGPRRRRPLPRADRRAARRGADVREVARRQRDERRGRRGAAGRPRRGDHEGRRRPVRPLRPLRAARLRRRRRAASARTRRCARRSCSARSSRPTTSRCCSTASRGAGHDARAGRARPRRDPRRARVLDDRHRAVGRAEPRGDAGRARGARRRDAITVHDLDHRPMFWADERGRALGARGARARDRRRRQPRRGGGRGRHARPDAAAAALLELGVELAIVKRGPEGVLARTRDERVEVPPVPVDVVCGLGAGDAFGGALVHGLLHGLAARARRSGSPTRRARYVAGRLACADAMPTAGPSSRRCA